MTGKCVWQVSFDIKTIEQQSPLASLYRHHSWQTSTSLPSLANLVQTARDCWTVTFGNAYTDEDRCLAAGYDNGDVKLFDLRTQTMRWETNVKNGVTGLSFDRNDIEMNKVSGAGIVTCL